MAIFYAFNIDTQSVAQSSNGKTLSIWWKCRLFRKNLLTRALSNGIRSTTQKTYAYHFLNAPGEPQGYCYRQFLGPAKMANNLIQFLQHTADLPCRLYYSSADCYHTDTSFPCEVSGCLWYIFSVCSGWDCFGADTVAKNLYSQEDKTVVKWRHGRKSTKVVPKRLDR